MPTHTLDDIQAAATAALRAYLTADPEDRTTALREAAEALVEAREHFYTADGSPDWRGRSFAYRTFNGETFSAAHIPAEELAAVRAAVRYHVGNVLRERLDAEQLDALGLRALSPRERSVEQRAATSATLAVLRGGARFRDAESIRHAVAAVSTILARVDAAALRALPADERRALAALLAAEVEAAGRLRLAALADPK